MTVPTDLPHDRQPAPDGPVPPLARDALLADVPTWLANASSSTPAGRLRPLPVRALRLWMVLRALAADARPDAPIVLPQRVLADLLGVSRSTVRRARNDLIEARALQCSRAGRKGSRWTLPAITTPPLTTEDARMPQPTPVLEPEAPDRAAIHPPRRADRRAGTVNLHSRKRRRAKRH